MVGNEGPHRAGTIRVGDTDIFVPDISPNVFLSWHFFVCEDVPDGDTIHGMLDQRFYDYKRCYIRLYGINCPEMHAPDPAVRDRARAAQQFSEDRTLGKKLLVNTLKPDKYALRIVGTVYYPTPEVIFGPPWRNLNDELLAAGHAVIYKPGSAPSSEP